MTWQSSSLSVRPPPALELQRTGIQPPEPPAEFNRVAASADADVLILLEAGAIPAPGALDRLVAAIERDPTVGIAGPSTNLAWNEQCAFPCQAGDPATIARTGQEAVRRFGDETRSLAPLYSIADFCFAVRREVIDAIGGADEGYGFGPCWEMEYAARAARAGFTSVWVCGAYVWRAPLSPERAHEEERLFEASRRRYQDSLCGLRLRGVAGDYEAHCRGDACEHFAPARLIKLYRPLPLPPPTRPPGTRDHPAIAPPRPAPSGVQAPLVSCVMPTGGRPDFALQAVRLFQRQDYPNRELVILDDAGEDLASRLPGDERIRCYVFPPSESLGAKRNRACELARGAYIAQWDDDDWYGDRRLSAQLAPLIAGRADITGLAATTIFDLEAWRFWSMTAGLHTRMFRESVPSGTLVFSRRVWQELAQYPHISLAEDAAFLGLAMACGARLDRVDSAGLFLYVRHGANTWGFTCGEDLDPLGWREVAEPAIPPEDRAFYAARARVPAISALHRRKPLVSCVMPTYDRRRWVGQAIGCFLRQDYPHRELIVLDDGTDPVGDLIPPDPRIRYVRWEERLVLGEKRNRACELARGEIIAHWDDDDWQAAHRLTYQVEQLERHGAAICGLDRLVFFDPIAARAWLYQYPAGWRGWVAGGTLCYRKDLWAQNPFPHLADGEDSRFVWSPGIGRLLALSDHRFFAALIHPENTSRKETEGPLWTELPISEVAQMLGGEYHDYVALT